MAKKRNGNMDNEAESGRHKVQIYLSTKALAEVDDLMKKHGASTRVHIIRNALRWLYWCTNQVESGAAILIERDKKVREIVFPFGVKSPEQK